MRYIDWFGDGSVVVLDCALACCAIETEAARPSSARTLPAPPPDARLVVTVSGTLTAPLAPLLKATIDAQPVPPTVVAVGACACSGGPYWDALPVVPGIADTVHVDHFIAGCPPPPEAIDAVMRQVRDA